MTDMISPSEFHAAEGAGDWRVISDGATAFYRTATFAESARLVQALGESAAMDPGRAAVDIRHDGVTIRILTITAEFAGMSRDDLELARQISRVAQRLGLAADPSAAQSILIIPGAPVISEVVPFWRAVLGYEPRADSPDEDLVDPHDRGPAFWFETMREPRGDGGGAIHLSIWVAPEFAEARVKAALAAGGHIVRDKSPMWWTLADAAGNEADIATVTGRD